jgi:hypothetical protein
MTLSLYITMISVFNADVFLRYHNSNGLVIALHQGHVGIRHDLGGVRNLISG